MTGLTIDTSVSAAGERVPILEIRGLAKSFRQRTLWDQLSFVVRSGEMIAVRGASGSGKSTLPSSIGLLDTPDAGQICIDGTDVLTVPRRRHKHLRRNVIGYLFQDYALLENATVRENLDIAARPRPFMRRPDYAAALDKVGVIATHSERVSQRCSRILNL